MPGGKVNGRGWELTKLPSRHIYLLVGASKLDCEHLHAGMSGKFRVAKRGNLLGECFPEGAEISLSIAGES